MQQRKFVKTAARVAVMLLACLLQHHFVCTDIQAAKGLKH